MISGTSKVDVNVFQYCNTAYTSEIYHNITRSLTAVLTVYMSLRSYR